MGAKRDINRSVETALGGHSPSGHISVRESANQTFDHALSAAI